MACWHCRSPVNLIQHNAGPILFLKESLIDMIEISQLFSFKKKIIKYNRHDMLYVIKDGCKARENRYLGIQGPHSALGTPSLVSA